MPIKIGDLVRIKYNDVIMEMRLTEEMCGNIITPTSPIGQALLGKEKGDVFTVRVPNGLIEVEVLEYDSEYWDDGEWLIDD
jgi:transcription elongation GreA/GreB family factor